LVNNTDAHRKQCKFLSPEKKVNILETDAAAHKNQCKFLPPEKKVKILETDADAHEKKQQSLSPEDKDLFKKNNTAAQHKHLKSLSPDQKAQENTKNSAEHKKQYELLPPEKKARLMETKTEQRHEHLTEEEKKISAQIRSVAATLYERVDLDKPTVEFIRELFYKDPTLALAYFIVVQQILVWQYSMTNYNQTLMN
jgi:hypothetical protein